MGCRKLTYRETFPTLKVVYNDLTVKENCCVGGYRYGFNGMERDDAIKGKGNSYTTQFRQYDSRVGRWLTLDPKANKFPWQSPYAGYDDNPILKSDPKGAKANKTNAPIYDKLGNLLGTDDKGLKGKAIIMDKSNFKQGMKHKDALNNSVGYKGLINNEAKAKFSKSYNSLSKRPDYDGYLTFFEAIRWYNGGSGKPLYVDAKKINFFGITLNDVKSDKDDKDVYINTYNHTMMNTGGVYGHIKITILNEKTGQVKLGLKGHLLDKYDYTEGSSKGKIADRLYPGKPKKFNIYCYDCKTKIAK